WSLFDVGERNVTFVREENGLSLLQSLPKRGSARERGEITSALMWVGPPRWLPTQFEIVQGATKRSVWISPVTVASGVTAGQFNMSYPRARTIHVDDDCRKH
ncbi:MAG TPA: hypothetical protein VN937_12835, partial [Blastocatellia bacterium]|nr:hypothetical protein [Blastocatellia bacterium]